MNTLLSILCAVLIFGAIVTIHEFGHYRVARWCNIDVREFAIGMGPVIYKKQGKNTLFTLRALPIGGFCAMGEDEEASATDVNNFRNKPVWARMLVIVAGAVMNLILGFIIGIIIIIIDGQYISSTIADVVPGTPSASVLQVGDEIKKINGRTVFTASDIVYALRNDEDGALDFEIVRDGQRMTFPAVQFTLTVDEETGARTLNYDFKVKRMKATALDVIPCAARSFMYYARLVLISLYDLITGKYGLNDLQGPVGIVSTISQTAQQVGFDIGYLLDMAMLITVNVGIFNLLPLPALDGGRFVFLLIEAIRRKPLSAQAEGAVHFAGFALLMLLMLAVTFKDVRNLFTPQTAAMVMHYLN